MEQQSQISERMRNLLARKAAAGNDLAGDLLNKTVVSGEKKEEKGGVGMIAESLDDPKAQAEEARILAGMGTEGGVEKPTVSTETLEPPTEPTQGNKIQAQQYLDRILEMPRGMDQKALLQGWLVQNGSTVDENQLGRAMRALGAGEIKRLEVPTEPMEFRRFIRERVREVVRLATNENQLSINAVEQSLMADLSRAMGLDPTKGFRVELFPHELGVHLAETRQLVEKEIQARANLRILQIKEEIYLAGDKKQSQARYIAEMAGSEGNPASPSVISIETYRWLKGLDSLGDHDGATTEKVDKALSVFLKLGEEHPDFSDPEISEFAEFRNGEKNVYDPDYVPARRDEAFDLIAKKFGGDAMTLARQLFQAYKEEGNYNKNHYLFSLYRFSDARKESTNSVNPTYIGSRRIYMPGQEEMIDGHIKTHGDEISHLALSPLRVQAKIGETVDGKDIKEPGIYLGRALEGKFLHETELVNPKWVKKVPEMEAYAAIKFGVKVKTAIEGVGTLGDEPDKAGAIPKAKGFLTEMRTNGQLLVASKVLSQEELDEQIYWEARNVLWELSILNPINSRGMAQQNRQRPRFLTPSGLAQLMVDFGDKAGATDFDIINDLSRYTDIRTRVQRLIQATFDVFDNENTNKGGIPKREGDEKLIAEQKLYLENKKLPEKPGESIKDVATGVAGAIKFVTRPQNAINEKLVESVPMPRWLKKFLGRPVF